MARTVCSGLMALACFFSPQAMAAEPPTTDRAYSWTGFYAGVHSGFHGSNKARHSATDGGGAGLGEALSEGAFVQPARLESGITGGAVFGYNYQSGAMVVGFEADLTSLDSNESNRLDYPGGMLAPMSSETKRSLDYLGTLRARIGYLPSERILLFVSGGLAYGKSTTSIAWECSLCGPPADISASDTADFGYAVGAGVEAAIGGNWTIRGEYLYYDLGTTKTTLTYVYFGSTSTLTAKTEHDGGIGRIALTLKF